MTFRRERPSVTQLWDKGRRIVLSGWQANVLFPRFLNSFTHYLHQMSNLSISHYKLLCIQWFCLLFHPAFVNLYSIFIQKQRTILVSQLGFFILFLFFFPSLIWILWLQNIGTSVYIPDLTKVQGKCIIVDLLQLIFPCSINGSWFYYLHIFVIKRFSTNKNILFSLQEPTLPGDSFKQNSD